MTPSVERTVYLTLLVVSTKSVEQFFSRHAENYGTMVEVSPASVGPHREPEGDAEGSQQAMVPLWINGREEPGSSTFDVVCPHDNQTCWKAASATTEDAFQAVEAAQSAFPNWSKTKPSIRQETLLRAAQLLEGRAEDYAGFMTLEMGAESGLARYFVLALSIKMLRDIAYRISSVCGSTPTCQEDGTSAMVCKEPYGVVLGIAPWNAPYVFGIRAAATAIATGNTTVLKGSELTPRCYWAIGKAFSDAGLPNGVLNIIYCRPSDAPEVVNAMIEHPAIRKVNFTGSTNTGRKIGRACGQNLKPCLMELGGKNSAIVLPDADLEEAAKACIAGSFLNSGQICMATDRIIVHSSIASAFQATLKRFLSPTHGPSASPTTVISSTSQSRLQSLVSDALSTGAHLLYGNNDKNDDGKSLGVLQQGSAGGRFAPVVLGGIEENMVIWQEEVFGPVVGVMIAEDEDHAVKMANTTGYGLSAAVFTRDLRKGLALAKRLESGAVHINSMTIRDEPALPMGGVKNSGWGRFNSSSGMEEFLVTKVVTWKD
ncbi:MAG: hypothetical protein HETSPECPRED_002479 [Heterodermia speciosa]|uniref:Aldehyde dehydrogenase domain-containing protein n=1 Tax=Heterodermia speciosa TaxID=116794 RepID=A0A8H3J4Y9_9LECA|nr:MAG: hypothetical protein HETSPECPRED_002479 [Heterodermia speciosa]